MFKVQASLFKLVEQMGVAAVAHLYVFPAVPYKRGERCVRNVSVMANYASLGSPLDPEEVRDCERTTRMRLARHDEREKRLNFPQSVRDVVLGSGEIVRYYFSRLLLFAFELFAKPLVTFLSFLFGSQIVDDMKYTVSHVVEPVERGIAKINKTFHQISENVKRHEERRRNTKDDSYVIPLNSWSREFSEVHDSLSDGSFSDSGLSNGKRQSQSKASATSRIRTGR